MDNWGTLALAVGTFLASVLAARLTGRITRNVEKDKNETSQMEILLSQYRGLAETYQKDRAEDAAEIATLKTELERLRQELDEVKKKHPLFRAEIRKLRAQVHTLGGDPGPWPDGLD